MSRARCAAASGRTRPERYAASVMYNGTQKTARTNDCLPVFPPSYPSRIAPMGTLIS